MKMSMMIVLNADVFVMLGFTMVLALAVFTLGECMCVGIKTKCHDEVIGYYMYMYIL